MATTWYGRNAGNDANGIGFDSSISGGTNFANQNNPHVVFDGSTIAAHAATATATILVTGYTVATTDVGNYFNITGGSGFTTGRYKILSVNVGAVTWTLDRTCTTGLASGATGNMGGAASTSVPITALVGAGDSVVWLPSDFAATGTLPVDHTQCGGTDTAAFPVPFFGGASHATVAHGGQLTNSAGHDWIAASDSGGSTQLQRQEVTYNATSGACYVLIQRDLSHTTNATIYGWAGNANITTSLCVPGGVWTSDYRATYEGGDGSTLNLNDGTSNANNGTNHGATATSGPGSIPGAIAIVPNNYVDLGNGTGLEGDKPFSIVDYVLVNSLSTIRTMWGTTGNGGQTGFHVKTSGKLGFDKTQNAVIGTGTAALSTATWYRVGLTYDGSGNWIFYIAGAVDSSGNNNQTFSSIGNAAFGINQNAGSENMDGALAAIRKTQTVLSADYFTADFNAYKPSSTFYTWSGWAGSGGGSTNYTLTAAGGTFALTPTNASPHYGRHLSAASAAFAWTGTNASPHYGRHLSAATATFVLTGTNTNLHYNRYLSAASASFVLSGTNAVLAYTPAGTGTHYVLTAAGGVFVLTPTNASPHYGRHLVGASASFALSGLAAALAHGRYLVAASTSYVLGSASANLLRPHRHLVPASGIYVWTGTPARLLWNGKESTPFKRPIAPVVLRIRHAIQQLDGSVVWSDPP